MMYEYFAKTDRGLVRENNEDAVALDTACGLAVLADGMGGYNAGEVASGMATESLRIELGRWLAGQGRRASTREVRSMMEVCVDAVNESIYESARQRAEYAGMGTTLVVGVFQPDARLVLGHIGDSRCYRLRDNTLQQATRDHSLLQEQLDAGLITSEQAAVAAHHNLITRALGVELGVQLEVNEYKVAANDLYLMCSDGLSDMVDDHTIAAILARSDSLASRAQALVDAAHAGGGRDNISVLLVQAGGAGGGGVERKCSFLSRLVRG